MYQIIPIYIHIYIYTCIYVCNIYTYALFHLCTMYCIGLSDWPSAYHCIPKYLWRYIMYMHTHTHTRIEAWPLNERRGLRVQHFNVSHWTWNQVFAVISRTVWDCVVPPSFPINIICVQQDFQACTCNDFPKTAWPCEKETNAASHWRSSMDCETQ